jgi:hypothetical protein
VTAEDARGEAAPPPTTLLQAIDQIEAEAVGHSILQPGAAFALGNLGCVADAGPGATAASIAVTLGRSDPVVTKVVEQWRKTRPMAPTQQLGGRPVAEDFLALWKLLDMLASSLPDPPPDEAMLTGQEFIDRYYSPDLISPEVPPRKPRIGRK